MKKKSLILIVVVIFIIGLGLFFTYNKNKDEARNKATGGYGSYLRELKCSILEINDHDIIAILEEDTSSPENLKKGETLKLNFDTENQVIAPKELSLAEGDLFTLIYLAIDESGDLAEVDMENPTKIKGRY